MDLLVVRHAVAEDRETFAKSGKDDAALVASPPTRGRPSPRLNVERARSLVEATHLAALTRPG
jgi:hypothetical protein